MIAARAGRLHGALAQRSAWSCSPPRNRFVWRPWHADDHARRGRGRDRRVEKSDFGAGPCSRASPTAAAGDVKAAGDVAAVRAGAGVRPVIDWQPGQAGAGTQTSALMAGKWGMAWHRWRNDGTTHFRTCTTNADDTLDKARSEAISRRTSRCPLAFTCGHRRRRRVPGEVRRRRPTRSADLHGWLRALRAPTLPAAPRVAAANAEVSDRAAAGDLISPQRVGRRRPFRDMPSPAQRCVVDQSLRAACREQVAAARHHGRGQLNRHRALAAIGALSFRRPRRDERHRFRAASATARGGRRTTPQRRLKLGEQHRRSRPKCACAARDRAPGCADCRSSSQYARWRTAGLPGQRASAARCAIGGSVAQHRRSDHRLRESAAAPAASLPPLFHHAVARRGWRRGTISNSGRSCGMRASSRPACAAPAGVFERRTAQPALDAVDARSGASRALRAGCDDGGFIRSSTGLRGAVVSMAEPGSRMAAGLRVVDLSLFVRQCPEANGTFRRAKRTERRTTNKHMKTSQRQYQTRTTAGCAAGRFGPPRSPAAAHDRRGDRCHQTAQATAGGPRR